MSRPPSLSEDRYGAPPALRRWALLGVVGVAAVLFLTWVAWAAWFHATPQVTSELIGYDIVDSHTALARVDVDLRDGDAEELGARCLVRATAADHTTVGELSFPPSQGRNEVEIRTEREATSVSLVGCTTPDQRQPR